jgi:hypothetical protein
VVEVAVVIVDLHFLFILGSCRDLSANKCASVRIHGAVARMTNGGDKNLMVLEVFDREQVGLDEVSDESPQVSSCVKALPGAINIQHHSVESVGLVLFDQELLVKCTCSDAISELVLVDLVLTLLLMAGSESQHLQLVGEVAGAHHEVEGLDDAVVGEGLRSLHRVHDHDGVAIQGALGVVSHDLLVGVAVDRGGYEKIRVLGNHLLPLLLLGLCS